MNKSLKWGGGENEMEGQRQIFAFMHKFATEDPAVQFYGVIATDFMV